MSTTDDQLLAQICDGDKEAFASLYDRHAARVLGFLVRMLRDRSEADDMLQATFLQVWRSAATYRGSGRASSAGAWIRVIARSRAIDTIRRRRAQATLEAIAEPALPDASALRAEHSESTAILREALARLPDDQGRAVHLAFYAGMTHQEIAVHLDVPLGTAKTWIRRGMEGMRTHLRGYEGASR